MIWLFTLTCAFAGAGIFAVVRSLNRRDFKYGLVLTAGACVGLTTGALRNLLGKPREQKIITRGIPHLRIRLKSREQRTVKQFRF